MRPYLAVLKDSFREALSSRVLWILLIVITVVLVLVAPLGFKERKATRFQRNTARNWPSLYARILDQAGGEAATPGKLIFARFNDGPRKKLAESSEQSPGELSGEAIDGLIDELNRVVEGPALYDDTSWQEVGLVREARELVERRDNLTPPETARLNRLLIEAAWPAEFRKDEVGETRIVYLGFESEVVPLPHKQLMQFVGITLTLIINYAVGVFGVFAAILVTSSIIPQMFEPGAIDLLLSKPVSRVLLFLTKFAGGCVFIGLIGTYFISGLWLIAGTRFGIWNSTMFLCIPIILFLFAIYYGVSALAGVLWRNAIVSVVVTVLFWALCFSFGMLKGFIEPFWINFPRLVKVIPAGSALLAVNESGTVHEWHARDTTWNVVFAGDDGSRPPTPIAIPQQIFGPVFDTGKDRIVAAQAAPPGRGGGFNLFAQAPPLFAGNRAGAWNRKKLGAAPLGTIALFARPSGEILAVTKGAVFQLSSKTKGKGAAAITQEEFVRRGPEPTMLLDPAATVAMNPDTGAIAAFSRGTILIVEPDESGKYVRKMEKQVVPASESKAAVAAFAGQTIAVALADGRLLIVDAADLSVKHEFRPEGDNAPRFAAASPGGRWISVLFHNRKLWLFDARNDRATGLSIGGQGDISAVAFDGPNKLVAIDRGTRATTYELDPFRIIDRTAPDLNNVEIAYYYFIMPIYTLLPKPGEIGNAVAYLLTDLNELQELGQNSHDLSQHREKVAVAGPIWSSLAFLAVVLSLASVYVWRTDF